MVNLLQLLLVTVFVITTEILCSEQITNIISEYYKSDLVKKFYMEWIKYRKPFENGVETSLKENFGKTGMNVYVNHVRNTRKITRGFYFSDNIVNVLFYDMVLRDWPNLIMPEVTLSLPSNLLKVEGTVSKMFLDTSYRMARNESAVLYSMAELDLKKNSPFSLQQVQSSGKLTIAVEDCFLTGFAIMTLSGNSVNLGHSTFRLVDCKFTVEISSEFGSPPVIAPYFPRGPGKKIERLLSAPIRDELVQNLQGAMYSYINTSLTFGAQLPKYKNNQQRLFKYTTNYLSRLCKKLNELTLEERRGSITLRDFDERIESKSNGVESTAYLALKGLKLYGLDTAYASRTGGSYKDRKLNIADNIRFHTMQIRGKAFYDNGTQSSTHDFAAELTDVSVNVIINIDKRRSEQLHQFEVLFARSFDFSVLPWETVASERVWYKALVSGYIINELPARITEHLSRVLKPVVNTDDHDGLKFQNDELVESEAEENYVSSNTKKVKVHSDDNPVHDSVVGEELDMSAENHAPAEQLNGNLKNDHQNLFGITVGDPIANANDNVDNNFSTEALIPNPDVSDPKDSGLNNYKQKLPSEKMTFSLEKKKFSDDEEKKQFFSDFKDIEKEGKIVVGGETDASFGSDVFSDDEGNKSLFSDNSDDKLFLTDDDEKEQLIDNGDGPVAITNEDDKNDEMADYEPESNGQEKEMVEQSGEQSVLIERTGKSDHRIKHDMNNKSIKNINKRKPIAKIPKHNKKDSNNLKLTSRNNPRAKNTHVKLVQKNAMENLHRIHTSQVHNNTRMHMSDNEVR